MPHPYHNWATARKAEISAIREYAHALAGRFAFFHVDGPMYLSGTDSVGNVVFVIGPRPTKTTKTIEPAKVREYPHGGCWPIDSCPTNWARLTGAPTGDYIEANNAVHLAACAGRVPGYGPGPVFTGGGTLVPSIGSAMPAYPCAVGIEPTEAQAAAYRDMLRPDPEPAPAPTPTRDPAPPREAAKPAVVATRKGPVESLTDYLAATAVPRPNKNVLARFPKRVP